MSDKQTENLYTFIDGELGDHETRFLLRSLDHDNSLRKKWQRFHYSRSVLNEPLNVDASCLSARITEALAHEAAPELIATQGTAERSRWLKPLTGMAVAASVVFAAFAYLQIKQPTPDVSSIAELDLGRAELNPQTIDASEPTVRQSAVTVASSELDPRLRSYLMRHTQVSSRTQSKSLIPYIHVIRTPTEAAAENDTKANTSQ